MYYISPFLSGDYDGNSRITYIRLRHVLNDGSLNVCSEICQDLLSFILNSVNNTYFHVMFLFITHNRCRRKGTRSTYSKVEIHNWENMNWFSICSNTNIGISTTKSERSFRKKEIFNKTFWTLPTKWKVVCKRRLGEKIYKIHRVKEKQNHFSTFFSFFLQNKHAHAELWDN